MTAQNKSVFSALLVLVCIIAVICTIGAFTLSKTDETIQGQAEVSEYRVSSKVPARILEIKVSEGQSVNVGDTLVILEAPDIQAKLAQAEAVQSAAQAQNNKAEKGAREEQIQALYEVWQKALVGVDIAEKSYRRVENLFNEGVMSEQKRDEVKAQYDAAVATEKAAKAQYDMAVNGAQKEDKEMAAAQLRQAHGAVAEVNSYISETILTATIAGEVSEIYSEVGELVGTGAPIMSIAVMDDMWATFNVREDLLKELPMGKEIETYIPALDKSAKFKINYIKDLGSFATWKATKTTGQYDLKTFEVRALPLSSIEGLRPGMSVLIQEDRKNK